MPSPFPGMDPFLEAHWGDVHSRLTLYACDEIQAQLPSDLRARVEEYLTVESDDEWQKHYAPDVRIVECPDFPPPFRGAGATALEIEPLVMEINTEPITLRAIRIIDTRTGNRVVTGIEFVSPGNMIGRANRKQYRSKRNDLIRGRANVVEIDLTRTGRHILAIPEARTPPAYRTPYRVCVSRAAAAHKFEIYRLPLQEKLPKIRIPLRRKEGDVFLDLQALISKAWQLGGYDDLNYSAPLDPPLRGKDAAWTEALLREKGLLT